MIEPGLVLILKVILGCALVAIAASSVLGKQKKQQQDRVRNRSRFNKRKK
jgi:hypothetical protein